MTTKPGELSKQERLRQAAPKLLKACERMLLELQKHWIDGECYCLSKSEGGHGVPCAHCTTGELLTKLGWRGDQTALRAHLSDCRSLPMQIEAAFEAVKAAGGKLPKKP